MKRYLLAFFVSILALASCTKGLEEERIDGNNTNDNNAIDQVTTYLTFSSERPQLEPSTKTAWDGSKIVWSENDKIRIGFTFNEEWWGQNAAISGSGNVKFYTSNGVTIDSEKQNIGTFTVPVGNNAFTGPTESGEFVFYSFYPSTLANTNTQNAVPDIYATLNSYQYPVDDSFDPKTDILVGNSHTITTSEPGFPTETIDLYWKRVVAHGYFTLKNFQRIVGFEDDETITQVVFTAQEGANLTGKQKISLATGDYLGDVTSNTVTLDGTNLSFVNEVDPTTSEEQTNLKVWLSVMPLTLTALDVVVETDKATYHKSWTGISKTLMGNRRNTMGINMASATREKKNYYWVKRDISAITTTDVFVIVGDDGDTYAMSNNSDTSAPSAVPVSVTATGDKLIGDPSATLQWNLSKQSSGETTYYTFYPNGSTTTWLYCTSSTGDVVRVGTGDNKLFEMGRSGYLVNTVGNSRRYIGIYDSTDWRCYARSNNGQIPNINGQTFAFYVRVAEDDDLLTPSISFTSSPITVNMGESVSNMASTDPSGLALTYYSDDDSIASVDPDTGEVTGISRGTTTIHANFAGNASYNPASATCEVNVVNPGDLYTITFKKGTTFTTNVTSYTNSTGFVNTCDELALTLRYINNGGNEDWTEMRAGRNRQRASVATITTNSAIPEAINSVTLSITQVNTNLVNSVMLFVSTTNNFNSADSYPFNVTGTGDVTATITAPATNMYYRIEIDLKGDGSYYNNGSNGHFRFNKIIYAE